MPVRGGMLARHSQAAQCLFRRAYREAAAGVPGATSSRTGWSGHRGSSGHNSAVQWASSPPQKRCPTELLEPVCGGRSVATVRSAMVSAVVSAVLWTIVLAAVTAVVSSMVPAIVSQVSSAMVSAVVAAVLSAIVSAVATAGLSAMVLAIVAAVRSAILHINGDVTLYCN